MPILHALLAASQLMSLPAPASRTCAAVDVVAPQQRRATMRRSFSAAHTLDLELRTRLWPVHRISGDHVLRLKLFTPRGYLYQEITVPFHRESSRSGKGNGNANGNGNGNGNGKGKAKGKDEVQGFEPTRIVPGFPRPLKVQKTEGVRRGRRRFDQVTARLPVAGTSITLGSLFGRWTVVPYLDDETAPCGQPRRFVIRK
jgi:hypothetical protein